MRFESPAACTQGSRPALRAAIPRAGNNAVDVDNVTPASCPGVISVAASDRTNTLAPYSSRGPYRMPEAPTSKPCRIGSIGQ